MLPEELKKLKVDIKAKVKAGTLTKEAGQKTFKDAMKEYRAAQKAKKNGDAPQEEAETK